MKLHNRGSVLVAHPLYHLAMEHLLPINSSLWFRVPEGPEVMITAFEWKPGKPPGIRIQLTKLHRPFMETFTLTPDGKVVISVKAWANSLCYSIREYTLRETCHHGKGALDVSRKKKRDQLLRHQLDTMQAWLEASLAKEVASA